MSFDRNGGRWKLLDVAGDDLEPLSQTVRDRKCRTVCLLPKSQYLVRTLELPVAGRAERDRMLALEVEAMLPQDYGPAEIAYLDLPSENPGRRRCEVYIARRRDLARWVHLWRAAPPARLLPGLLRRSEPPGLVILPSAVIWRQLLTGIGDTDLLVIRPASGTGELALMDVEQSLVVRTVPWDQGRAGPGGFQPELAECLRTALSERREGYAPLTVGWLGKDLPTQTTDDRLIFHDLGERLAPPDEDGAVRWQEEPILSAAADVLLHSQATPWAESANLLPSELLRQRRRRSLHGRVAMSLGCVLLALGLSLASLKLLIWRCENLSRDLNGRIAMIRTEGEATGRKLRQLAAIDAARRTRNDFGRVLDGLYEATPAGVTYNRVVLDEEGRISLHGQAPTLALPFLLPERLEAEPVFANVVPRGAGQVRRGDGTIAEFRVDCRIAREVEQ